MGATGELQPAKDERTRTRKRERKEKENKRKIPQNGSPLSLRFHFVYKLLGLPYQDVALLDGPALVPVAREQKI